MTVFLMIIISCNASRNKNDVNNVSDTSENNTTENSAKNNNEITDNDTTNTTDASASADNSNADSMLAAGMSGIFGKNDSGLMDKMGGGKNMDSMLNKIQTMTGDKSGNPGNALSKLILNTQLGQLPDDNPLKSVAKEMQEAQENGTAGPDKTYSAVYTPARPGNYIVPVSGSGNTIMLQYSGGTVLNGKKDGLWKNVFISTGSAQWNVFTEGYVSSSSINMKIHAALLSSIHENYSINLNEQYKKYSKQLRSEAGQYEFNVQVQKLADEKMFGYNCTHVKISYTVKALGQTSHEENQEWYSTDVPGAQYVSPVIFENHAPAVVTKIIAAGCSGILVKSWSISPGSSYIMQLSGIIKKDMSSSQFSIPANYVQDKNTVLYDIQ